jgi:Holliday junction resolvasome RuvABC endonuclease subunit
VLILGIDPGVSGGHHGWALLDATPGQRRPRFVAGGHSPTAAVLAQLDRLTPEDRVAVETPSGYVWRYERGAALLAMAEAAGYLQGRAEARGLRVLSPSAQDWRRVLCQDPSASDDQIARAVAYHVDQLPKRSNPHVRDALGVGVAVCWGWRPPARQARLPLGFGGKRPCPPSST